ncbi:MAG: hypothetical protein FWH01_10060 [Oscillospiraceae bacterium]|nr:hypothetical protein [Oscillospiraceae bacterium]
MRKEAKMFNLKLMPRKPISSADIAAGMELSITPAGGYIDIAELPDLSGVRYLVLDITTLADMHLPIEIHFFKKGADATDDTSIGNMRMTTSSIPGVRAVMPYDLEWLDNRQVFKARTPGRMKTFVSGTALAASEVGAIRLRVREFYTDAKIIVHNAYLTDTMPDTALIDPAPAVDEFGQVASRGWPGKTTDAKEMSDRLTALHKKALESKSLGMPFPERYGYSKWGGDKNNKLTQGTGYFAVQKDGDVWYLVDPDGYAFFSVGPDCVGTNTASVLTGIEALYASLPDKKQYADAFSESPGHFGGDRMVSIDYYRVNMIRVFGDGWLDAYSAITEYLLKEMGFNTIANWSDPEIIARTEMAYVIPLRDFPTTKRLIFRDFPDVFSDEYAANSDAFAEQLKSFAGDPRLIGYFMRNEPQWGFSEDISLAREMFRYDVPFDSKRALWAFLIEKYGDSGAASKAWGIDIGSEERFLGLTLSDLPTADAGAGAGAGAEDLKTFSQMMVERYVATPAKALRAVDPNHLNLGMRYAFLSTDTMFMGMEHVDVFSINCYRNKPRESDVKNILERCGKPCLIGEYHHGSCDRGCFGNALRSAESAAERGVAYQYYTEQSAAMPSMLGTHYFCIGDEAALGRYDGESEIIGFVDVCHRPYEEMFEAAVKTHERIYSVKARRNQPLDTPPKELPSNCY